MMVIVKCSVHSNTIRITTPITAFSSGILSHDTHKKKSLPSILYTFLSFFPVTLRILEGTVLRERDRYSMSSGFNILTPILSPIDYLPSPYTLPPFHTFFSLYIPSLPFHTLFPFHIFFSPFHTNTLPPSSIQLFFNKLFITYIIHPYTDPYIPLY